LPARKAARPTADVSAREPRKLDQLDQQISSKAITSPTPFQAERRRAPVTAEPVDQPITVIIDGIAVAKARPRMTRRGFPYTPAHTRRYEAHARLAAQLAMNGRSPITGPVRIEVLVELPIPTSWSQRKRAAAITSSVRPTSKPDIDNYLKAALDAISTIAFVDDAQIVELRAINKYGVNPKTVVSIFPLDARSAR
jgi:Holliday junction resolvase RusA-like endonuclease